MHMISHRAERGFSMFITIMAMTVTAMFVAASFAAVNGDLPQSNGNKNRKASYAAAEAGLAYYLNHLQQNPDYWTLCDKAPDPNASEKSPVSQQWDGTLAKDDTRTWRKVPGGATQYTIEMLHTDGYTGCLPTDQKSVIDEASGTFKVRFTGRPTPTSTMRRSIVATFRRDSFLNFVYFTDFEDFDPTALSDSGDRATAQSKCAEKYRTARASTTSTGCPYGNEISFPDGDKVNGPAHTNDDSFMVCGSPSFGRSKTIDGDTVDPPTDTVEVRGGTPGYIGRQNLTQYSRTYTACTPDPTINAPGNVIKPNATYLGMPQSNQQLADLAKNNGKYYTGKTIIRLNGTTMDVTNYGTGSAVTTTNVAWPNNGVLYVDNGATACTPEVPTDADYSEGSSCGNVYVSGTYAKSLTIASRGDIIVKPTLNARLDNSSTDANLTATAGSDATLGLIADNFVRVAHRVGIDPMTNKCINLALTKEPIVTDVRIEAAILSLKHSFFLDNHNCGKLGTLTIVGAIAQHYRGTVSTFSGTTIVTGFTKNYWYDDRFRYRSPPYFLSPIDSAWDVVRSHEQVPAY
jgi:hypothetical protein